MILTTDQWIQLSVAIGTIIVAILAIWGRPITYFLGLGPKLHIWLEDPQGEFYKPVRYYHIKARNSHRWASATNVRVVISGIARPVANQDYVEQLLVGPLQLKRRFDKYHPQYSVLGPDATFDLGFIDAKKFRFVTYEEPDIVLGAIEPNQRARIELRALADNAESQPLLLEISWDGKWSDDTSQMAMHLVIEEIIPNAWYRRFFRRR